MTLTVKNGVIHVITRTIVPQMEPPPVFIMVWEITDVHASPIMGVDIAFTQVSEE